MYTEFDAVGLAVTTASGPDGFVARDRRRFAPFFKIAEQFAATRGLIMGGISATHLLLREPISFADHHYEFYSERALADARELTALLYSSDPEGLGHYASMRTSIPQKEFVISVDDRQIFRILALPSHRGVRIGKVIIPSLRVGRYDSKVTILCTGPEIRLMETYAALADPSRASDWPSLLTTEEKLRALFWREMPNKAATAFGGGGGKKDRRSRDLTVALIREYVSRPGRALVGSRAVSGSGRIQIVSAHSLESEEAAVRKIATRLGFGVQGSRNDPKLLVNSRLRRLTMYIIRPGERREPFLDVFNSGSFRLIAYVRGEKRKKGKYRSPKCCPFSIMYFLLVDMWTIQLLCAMKIASNQYTHHILVGLLATFKKVEETYLQDRKKGNFGAIFPPNYLGQYEDPYIRQKRCRRDRIAEQRKAGRRTFFPPYYPAKKTDGGA